MKRAKGMSVLSLALCFIWCTSAPGGTLDPGPVTGEPDQETGRAIHLKLPAEPAPAPELFTFHSSFWINLHHFLYCQTQEEGETARVPADLPPDEARGWEEALGFYRREMAARSLLQDDLTWEVKHRLAQVEDEAPSLAGSGLPPEVAAALEAAAPAYRRHFWPEHHQANQRFIQELRPRAAEHAELASELAAAYRQPWPDEPIRVDVSVYGGRYGAYTTVHPTHVTLAAADPRHQGKMALEILFHEASHGLIGPVREAIDRELKAQGKELPRHDLWHAVLFYTTGELVRRRLPGHRPYAEAQGLYQQGWTGFHRALEEHWQPYLEGEIGFDEAIDRLVASL